MNIALIAAIAAGKTTLSGIITEFIPGITIVDESLDIMTNIKGENQLSKYYSDMSRNALITELMFFITRLRRFNSKKNGITIIERDWYSGRKCFTEMLHEDGFLTDAEWIIYKEAFDFITSLKSFPKIDKYIYIRCSLDTLMSRMYLRGRNIEDIPSMKRYQERLSAKYEEFVETLPKDRVLIIDGNLDMLIEPNKNNVISKIKNFLGGIN
jgi:deoxyguanosine kinase